MLGVLTTKTKTKNNKRKTKARRKLLEEMAGL